MCLALFTKIYPEVLTTFSDIVKPIELRMDDRYIYISDQSSVFVYAVNTFKFVKKLCKKGEGPEEFRTHPRIAYTHDRLILCDAYKIIVYTRDFKLIKEIKVHSFTDRVNPIEDNFILTRFQVIDEKKCRVFSLHNGKLEKIKDLIIEPEIPRGFLIYPWSRSRSRNDKVYIAQPQKGLYIDVFNKYGKKLYHIEKKTKEIKSSDKHKKMALEKMRYFVGRRRFEKARARGVFKKPLSKFIPYINNFWVVDDKIYIKTYDITGKEEKYIIMDIKGTILKTVFLPMTYMEILTFNKNKFYYLMESENDDGWVLHSVDL